jgi:hypothetical protein
MLIGTMPVVLAWQSDGQAVETIYRSYVDLLSDALAMLLRRLRDTAPITAESLSAQLSHASETAILRVLTAPESSYRLLGHGDASDAERSAFLQAAFSAERAREGEVCNFGAETWTALGDTAFATDGRRVTEWPLDGVMPLDFGSPHAQAAAVEEMELDGARGNFEPFSSDEIASVCDRIEEAAQAIKTTRPDLMAFVNTFTRVLVCLKDSVAPDSFASGSTGQFIGRSFLANPHHASADAATVAEGIIHESIHGLLYMQERAKAWVSKDLYRLPPIIVSPWTQTPLRLRPYLQAAFVWYGLLHFWTLALRAETFAPERIRTRIAIASRGFLRGRLDDPLQQFRKGIAEDLFWALETMQEHVVQSVADTLPDLSPLALL